MRPHPRYGSANHDTPSLSLQCILAISLGGLGALSLAPSFFTPLLFVAFTGLFWLIDCARTYRGAFLLGWLFGLGHFLAGLSWIAESFYVDAEQFGALAIPAIGGLSSFLALFPAVACSIGKILGGGDGDYFWHSRPRGAWLRGHILTGFPWNLIGYAWGVSDETLQAASLLGVYGLGFLTIILAAVPGLAFGSVGRPGLRRGAPLAISLAGVVTLWGFGAMRLAQPEVADVPDVRLRIVQASIPQAIKWNPAVSERILNRYIPISAQPASAPPTHIIWPETAVPYLIAEDAYARDVLAAIVPTEGALITGGVCRTASFQRRPALLNSLLALDDSGDIVAAYDKVRLVPFGEYTPLRDILPLQ